jgi:hypothetical protein
MVGGLRIGLLDLLIFLAIKILAMGAVMWIKLIQFHIK